MPVRNWPTIPRLSSCSLVTVPTELSKFIVHTSNTAAMCLTNSYTSGSTSSLLRKSPLASTMCLVTFLYSQHSTHDLSRMYCCRWDICRSLRCHRWLGPNRQRYSGTRGLTVCDRADSGQCRLLPTVEPQSPPHSWQPGVHSCGQCSNLPGKAVSVIRGRACSVSISRQQLYLTALTWTPSKHSPLVCMWGQHCPTRQDHILASTQRTVCNNIWYWMMFHTTYNTTFLYKLSPNWLITTARYCVSCTYANGILYITPLFFTLTSYRTVNTDSNIMMSLSLHQQHLLCSSNFNKNYKKHVLIACTRREQ